MIQYFDKKGIPQAATILEAGPCFVSQIKTKEKDNYQAVQIAFGPKKKLKKPQKNHLAKAKISQNLKFLREFKTDESEKYQLGQEIKVDIFKENDVIEVIGISKGKGFAGTIKRHGFKMGPVSHGSHNIRQPGSIGSMFPQRVIKGMKMAGHKGSERVTVKNLKILKVDTDNNLIIVSGAIPGANKSLVMVKKQNS